MTDPLTPERLAEIEARFASGRVVNVATQRALLAEVRRLQAAAERVRALHQDKGPSQGYFPDDLHYSERDHCCGTCGSHGEYGVAWPCPTIAALDGDE